MSAACPHHGLAASQLDPDDLHEMQHEATENGQANPTVTDEGLEIVARST